MRLFIEGNGEKAVLHSPPTPLLLTVLPGLEGRKLWLSHNRFRFEATGSNIERIRDVYPELEVVRDWTPLSSEQRRVQRPAYVMKTEPFPHQKAAAAKMARHKRFALLMEQGTGKTKVAIDRAGQLWAAGEIDAVLIVGRKGVHRQWVVSQLPEHCGCDWSGGFWNGSKMIYQGARRESALQVAAFNFDALKFQGAYGAALGFAQKHAGRLMIIADETQEIKNASSARHKALVRLSAAGGAHYRLMLTGTPIANDLTDEWAQLLWLDQNIIGIKYLTTFRAQYCIMGGFEMRKVVANKNISQFKRLTEPYVFRATRAELGLLPPARRRWRFNLSAEQRELIAPLRATIKEIVKDKQSADVHEASRLAMRIQQISNGIVVDDNGKRLLYENPRLDALMEVLQSHPGKTIIWARFIADIELIAARLKLEGEHFVLYYGATSGANRAAAIDSFLRESGPRIFVSNPQAGGTGLNLQGLCRHAIYYSNSHSYIDRVQSEARIHRIGTDGLVVYTDLIATGGADAAVLSALARKKSLSHFVLDDLMELAADD